MVVFLITLNDPNHLLTPNLMLCAVLHISGKTEVRVFKLCTEVGHKMVALA